MSHRRSNNLSRRDVLKGAAAFGAATFLPSQVFGANDEIRVAFIGFRSRGRQLMGPMKNVAGVKVVALCDVDQTFLNEEAPKHPGATTHTDFREVLDRDDVDAVVIATPNHWHTPMAVMALAAGKHVYVEKPVSHTIWESQKIVEATKKYGKICAAGFQNRSDTGLMPFYEDLHNGVYGDVTGVRGLCYRNRVGIGRRQTPLTPPDSVDYDLWLGPAGEEPIYRDSFHYDWHWMWSFGNGDVGNQGPHEMDLINWALGDPKDLPGTVQSTGGRFQWSDAGETPNVLYTTFDHNGTPCVFEVNDVAVNGKTANYKGVGVGVVIGTTGGEFRGGRGGGRFYDTSGKEVKHYPGDGGNKHYQNFFDAIRANKQSMLRSPIHVAANSSSMSHLANISYRVGKTDSVGLTPPKTLSRAYDHLERAGVDFRLEHFRFGPNLRFDPVQHKFVGESAAWANRYLTKPYRKFSIASL